MKLNEEIDQIFTLDQLNDEFKYDHDSFTFTLSVHNFSSIGSRGCTAKSVNRKCERERIVNIFKNYQNTG